MLFNSFDFLLFFPIVVAAYFFLPEKFRQLWLLVASYYFYMGWNAKYALLIFFITLVSYAGALAMQSGPTAFFFIRTVREARRTLSGDRKRGGSRRVRAWVSGAGAHPDRPGEAESGHAGKVRIPREKCCFILCVTVILGILFVFKYLDFFAGNVLRVLRMAGFSDRESVSFGLILPVGISFYTFQALGYLIDVYRKEIPAERSFLKYALFVSFFPQLVAGPIERSKNLLKQLRTPKTFDYEAARNGLLLMLWGYFEKVCIADTASVYVNHVFEDYEVMGPGTVIWATVLFAVQIYCDFGGYSHIAIGAAQVLGIRLMDNFRQPYFAVSVQDFWRRWHISLSTWFRDYVYIPLGGSRCGRVKRFRNLMITFLVSGLWHGASWNYVVWGGLHGVYQIVGNLTRPYRECVRELLHIKKEWAWYRILQMLFTFILCDLAWLFFRASGFRQAVAMLRYMINPFALKEFQNIVTFAKGLDLNQAKRLYAGIAILFLVDLFHEKGIRLRKWFVGQKLCVRWVCYVAIMLGFVILLIQNYGLPAAEFIYFQF